MLLPNARVAAKSANYWIFVTGLYFRLGEWKLFSTCVLKRKKNIHYNPPEEIQLHISRVRFKAIVRLDKKKKNKIKKNDGTEKKNWL